MTFYEVCGFAGTGILSVALVPQYVYCIRQKTVKNISPYWLFTYLTALTLVIIYSGGLVDEGVEDLLPVLIAGVVEAFVALNFLALIILVRTGTLKWDLPEVVLDVEMGELDNKDSRDSGIKPESLTT